MKENLFTVTLKFDYFCYCTKWQRELELELGVVNLASPLTYLKDPPILGIG